MKKIDIGQTITTLANIGVIAGIVFLALELRQNNRLLRMQAQTQRAENRLGANEALYEDPSLASIFVKVEGGNELDAVERLRLERYYASSFIKWENEYQQFKAGFLNEQDLPVSEFRRALRDQPGMLEYWSDIKGTRFSPDFVAFIDGDKADE